MSAHAERVRWIELGSDRVDRDRRAGRSPPTRLWRNDAATAVHAVRPAPGTSAAPRSITLNTPYERRISPREGADTLDALGPAPGPRRVPAGRDPLELPSRWVVAGRYEILGLLGSGGMGTVYRARDRELDEIVALKMLRKQIANAAGVLERFRREVKLARRVTHRNVARTFDIGEHAGGKFLTMEFIAGEMLGATLARRGRLRLGEVVRIGIDLCAGLAAAHAASVLHRDLKPANVIIGPGDRAVITDFGIARALRAGESSRSASGVIGTPAYMAPEQLRGADDLDGRADLYALGVMLFELLAGEVPWASLTPIQGALARLEQPPPDLRTLRPSLSEGAAALVRKCMAMQREDRFESAEQLAGALEELRANQGHPSAPPSPTSRPPKTFVRTTVAVLSVVNRGDRADDYLAASLTEDLGDVLDAVPELRVRPPQYTTRSGADVIVDGQLRTRGERVEVSFRLSTVEDGFLLWEGHFDRPASELVAIADAAAAAIAETLTTKALAPPRPMPTNPAAHALYLRGRHIFLRGWFDAKGEAVRLLGEAHMLSPGDATIAATYARALARGHVDAKLGEDVVRSATEMAEKALLLDPRRADARLALATMHFYRGEGVGGATELRRAFAVSPQDPDVLAMLGRVRAEVGPLELAITNLEDALALEPRLTVARQTMARAWALLGDRRRAEESLGPQPSDPDELVPHAFTRLRLALWWAEASTAPELVSACAALRPRECGIARIIIGVAERRCLTGDDRARLEHVLRSGSATTQSLASFRAQVRAEVYMTCGEVEPALAAIREADANGLLDLSWLERCPVLEKLRGSGELEAIRRSTALRAARISDVLSSCAFPL